MRACNYTLAQLLPHAAPMILLDKALESDETTMRAALTIRDETLFRQERGVPSYIGLEYMAQTCGAFAGLRALAAKQPVTLGFLLGTRNMNCKRPWFQLGDRLVTLATLIWLDEEMSAFDCSIEIGGETVVSAQLNLFRPSDPERFLAKSAA